MGFLSESESDDHEIMKPSVTGFVIALSMIVAALAFSFSSTCVPTFLPFALVLCALVFLNIRWDQSKYRFGGFLELMPLRDWLNYTSQKVIAKREAKRERQKAVTKASRQSVEKVLNYEGESALRRRLLP